MSREPAQAADRGDYVATLNGGFIACLLGVMVMIAGRYMPAAPRWLVYPGVSIIVFGWGLLALSMLRRRALVRARAHDAKS